MKLMILHNEACRQRALDAANMNMAVWGGKHKNVVERLMRIHGQYTEGYYDGQLEALMEDLGSRKVGSGGKGVRSKS